MSVGDVSPALSGANGSCEFASTAQTPQGEISLPYSDDTNGDSYSVSFWFRRRAHTNVHFVYSNWRSQGANDNRGHAVYLTPNQGTIQYVTGSNAQSWHVMVGPNLAVNQFYYLTFTFEKTGQINANTVQGIKKIYVDGNLVGSVNNATHQPQKYAANKAPFVLGHKQWGSYHYTTNADYDELKIYDYAVSPNRIQQDMQERHTCTTWPASVDHIKITHDGNGVFYCPETFNISARKTDASVVTDYTETIQLTTSNNLGVWQKSPTNSLGTLTPSGLNDGRASYTFVPADNGNIDLRLVMPHGAGATQVNITDGTVSDDNSHAALNLASLGFEVDKVPGAGFGIVKAGENQTIELRAYNSNNSLNSCTLARSYAGPKNVQMRMDALNPISFQVAATVTPSGGSSVNLPTAASGYANVPLSFNNGIAQLTLNYPDVGKLRLRARDAANTAMQGTSIDFVSRPYRMALTVTNPDDPNTGDDVFAVAGEPITVHFQAYAKGDIPTRNFGLETPPVQMGTFPVHAWPSGGSVGTLSGNYSVNNGAFVSTDASYSEAGRLHFWAHMVWNGTNNNYLGVPVDYYSDVVSRSVAFNLGRFIPDKFEYSQVGTGQWSGGCNGYSYLGQTLNLSGGPKMKVTAVNKQGAKTANYRFGVSTPSMSYSVSYPGYDTQTQNREGNRLRVDLAVTQSFIQSTDKSVGGEMLLTPRASIRYRLEGRGKQDIAPFIPKVPIILSSLSDSDGVVLSVDPNNPNQIMPTALEARRGRVALESGHARSSRIKKFNATVEYFDGAKYVLANTDNCSSIQQLLVLDVDSDDGFDFTGGLNWKSGIVPASQNARNYQLSDGGVLSYRLPKLNNADASGSVEIVADVNHHLRYAWKPNGLISLPSAVVVYGGFSGQEDIKDGSIVLIQEMF